MPKKEIIIAQTDELKNGEMKTVYPDEGPEVLLIKVNDHYYATEPYCPHYGAPLETGIISGKKVMCPWHHARFDVQDGELSDPPALDGLTAYKLEIRDKDVVLFPDETIEKKQAGKSAGKEKDERTFLIIGGGAAGNAAMRRLRYLGFEGHLQMVSADKRAPYDRTNLSKDFLKGEMEEDWLPLDDADYFKDNDIDLNLEKQVAAINFRDRQVELSDKTRLNYDKLLLASGGRPKTIDVPGKDLKNVFTLRTVEDAENILNKAKKAKCIALIGASFICMEIAESLNNDDREIHIIAPESVPFEVVMGRELGQFILEKEKDEGIRFHLKNTVAEFKGNGSLETVALKNGDSIQADMAVIGIGVEPVTDFINDLEKQDDGSLKTDACLQVTDDVFAAGDIATFPYWKTDSLIRIEHWRVAQQMGTIAAHNMLDDKKKVDIIPFFWTNLAGLPIRYVGYAKDWDETIIRDRISKDGFIIYYIKNNRVQAALGVNRDIRMDAIEELMKAGKMPGPDILKDESFTVNELMNLL